MKSKTIKISLFKIFVLLTFALCTKYTFAKWVGPFTIDHLVYCVEDSNPDSLIAMWCYTEKNADIKNVVLPDYVEYNGKMAPVTEIQWEAAEGTNIETLVCGQNIRIIGKNAFQKTPLKKIVFPDKEVRIFLNAFTKCENLDTLVFNSKLTYLVSDDYFDEDIPTNLVFKGRAVFINNVTFPHPHYPDLDKMSTEITWEYNLPTAAPAKKRAYMLSRPVKEFHFDWGDGKHVICRDGLAFFTGKKITINGNTRFNSINLAWWGDLFAETVEFEKRIPWDKEPENTIDPKFFAFCDNLKTVICHDTEPWPVSDFTITQDMIDRGLTLYVPESAIETYKSHPAWGKFPTILPIENTVNNIETDNSEAPVEYFNLQGVRIDTPTPGTLVIRRQGTNVDKVIL